MLPPTADLSVTLNIHQVQPASDREEDLAAAEHVDLIANRIFLDPMFGGGYSARPDRHDRGPDGLVVRAAR